VGSDAGPHRAGSTQIAVFPALFGADLRAHLGVRQLRAYREPGLSCIPSHRAPGNARRHIDFRVTVMGANALQGLMPKGELCSWNAAMALSLWNCSSLHLSQGHARVGFRIERGPRGSRGPEEGWSTVRRRHFVCRQELQARLSSKWP
jgi:hypothetical protein